MGAIVLGIPEIWGPPISDKKFVNSVLKKKDPFGFKFYLKYDFILSFNLSMKSLDGCSITSVCYDDFLRF